MQINGKLIRRRKKVNGDGMAMVLGIHKTRHGVANKGRLENIGLNLP